MLIEKIKTYTLVGLLLILAAMLWQYKWHEDKNTDQQIASKQLLPNEKEKIILNQAHHTATIVQQDINGKESSRTVYINPRGPVSITEDKQNVISINQRTWGTERSIGIGCSMGNEPRIDAIVWLAYYKKLDLGVGVSKGFVSKLDIDIPLLVSYNGYKDWMLYAGYGPLQKQYRAGIGLRLF